MNLKVSFISKTTQHIQTHKVKPQILFQLNIEVGTSEDRHKTI
jgi:hypothetical protein